MLGLDPGAAEAVGILIAGLTMTLLKLADSLVRYVDRRLNSPPVDPTSEK